MPVTVDAADPTRPVVHVSGEVDLASAPELRAAALEALAGEQVTGVRVDLSGVEFIDSSGLSALVAATQRGEDTGRTVTLAGVTPEIERVLALSGLSSAFRLEG